MRNELRDLANAIAQRQREIAGEDGEDWAADRADAKDLMRALVRILCGESLRAAFGAPGDWGYSSQIGQALAKVYAVLPTGAMSVAGLIVASQISEMEKVAIG